MATLIGQTIGRYQIIEQLGQGGMATVYRAHDTRLERDVALKVLRTEQFPPAMLEQIRARFEREAKALAKLNHPNIVGVHDFGVHRGKPYLVMEYLPGGTLRQRLGKPIPWQEALKIILPIGRALQYAHKAGILHRDVKPLNILFSESGEPMLSDFGIAKLLETADTATLTGTGVGMGTPGYMSPEQGVGKPVDARTDVYSLGVILYELLTGRKPYTGDTPAAILIKQVGEPLPPPSQFIRGLPAGVENVLVKALAKEPGERYADMDAFLQALGGVSPGAPGMHKVEQSVLSEKMAKPPVESPQNQKKTPSTAKPTTISTAAGRKSLWVWMVVAAGVGVILLLVVFGGKIKGAFLPGPTATNTLIPTRTSTPTITFTPTPGIGSTWTRPADSMVMVFVPAGEFAMGIKPSYEGKSTSLDDYWIDQTEVTNRMYALCVEAGVCNKRSGASYTRTTYYSDPDYADYPVVNVFWQDAVDYCEWTGSRLPTEAEWEKAARGTDGRRYPWGDEEPVCDLVNFKGCMGDTNSVGSYPGGVSPYGALDMSGNVKEWVDEVNTYNMVSYGWNSTTNSWRYYDNKYAEYLVFGGSWSDSKDLISLTNRFFANSNAQAHNLGFRCVKTK